MSSQFHHVIKWLSFVVDPGPKHSMHDIYIYIYIYIYIFYAYTDPFFSTIPTDRKICRLFIGHSHGVFGIVWAVQSFPFGQLLPAPTLGIDLDTGKPGSIYL